MVQIYYKIDSLIRCGTKLHATPEGVPSGDITPEENATITTRATWVLQICHRESNNIQPEYIWT